MVLYDQFVTLDKLYMCRRLLLQLATIYHESRADIQELAQGTCPLNKALSLSGHHSSRGANSGDEIRYG